MPKRLFFAAVATATAIALLPLQPATAQGGLFGHLKDKAREKVQKGVDQAEDGITDAAYDKTTHAFKCALTDSGCVKRAEAAGKPVSIVDAEGKPVSSADSAHAIATANGTTAAAPAAAAAPPSLSSVQTHSDFKQGERVLYQTDFANAIIGDFPRNIQLDHGNVETVSFNGMKLLRTTSSSRLIIPLKEVLPQRFTMEFDYSGAAGWSMYARFVDESDTDKLVGGDVAFAISGEADIEPSHGASAGATFAGDHDFTGKLIHCQIMADSNYIKLYINGQRVAQSPNAPLGRSNRIFIDLTGSENSPAFFGNIRVGAGGRDMYGALTSEGRFTTHGILFATGSATIDPSSAATLTEIGQMLQQHGDLKLEIDGHTDNVGSAASNQTLSEKRAASVKQYLVTNFQIDGSRLSSKGFGASRPVASNATDDGKQQNRRVELVKM
jgi:outer membrane protein OmpA-like peptidoglycan-associated protein